MVVSVGPVVSDESLGGESVTSGRMSNLLAVGVAVGRRSVVVVRQDDILLIIGRDVWVTLGMLSFFVGGE